MQQRTQIRKLQKNIRDAVQSVVPLIRSELQREGHILHLQKDATCCVASVDDLSKMVSLIIHVHTITKQAFIEVE